MNMASLRSAAVAAPMLFVAAIAPRPVADRAPGLTYTFVSRIQMTDANGKSTDRVMMSGHAALLGDRARIDLDSMATPMNPAQGQRNGDSMRGMYFLTLDGGKRLVYVDPNKKQYMDMQMDGMLKGLSSITNATGGLVRMQASNVHIDAEKVGAGPMILGHATVHYRLTDSKTMNTKVLFKTSTTRDSTVSDLYYAPDLKNFVNPFLSNSQASMGALDLFGPEYKQQYMAAHAKLYQEGAPLRTVATSISTDGNGKVRTSVMTMEVTQMSTGTVSASLFDIPTDYTKIEAPNVAALAAAAQADSGAAPHADSAKAESKKDILKKGVRGLFGRP
jgi:hypothetical protein